MASNNKTKQLCHYRYGAGNYNNVIRRYLDYRKMKVVDEKYREEKERLKTLYSTNRRIHVPEHLKSAVATTGMFANEGGIAQCIYCRHKITDWKTNDQPHRRHKHEAPTCPYIIDLEVGNIPIILDNLRHTETQHCNDDSKNKIISTPENDTYEEIIEEMKRIEIAWRESTFENYSYLKQHAMNGWYLKTEGNSNMIEC